MQSIKQFSIKVYLVALSVIAVCLVIIKFTPIDEDNYLYEYNKKIKLLEKTEAPRIIFIGGSNLAFGLNSKIIEERLNRRVVNFGLHAGIGIKYILEDALEYIKQDDVVVVTAEYGNYFSGGNGNGQTLSNLLVATNFRKIELFNMHQWIELIKGVPRYAYIGYYEAIRNSIKKALGKPIYDYSKYNYIASGFNENGDEVSHYKYAGEKIYETKERVNEEVNQEFISWLNNILNKYEEKGAKVYMMPPVCTQAVFKSVYNENISMALKTINRPYLAEPSTIALPNNYNFNGGYHVDKEGAKLNSIHIADALNFLVDQKR